MKRQPFSGGHRAATGPGSQIVGTVPCNECGCGNCAYTNWNNKGEPTAIRCEGCGAVTAALPTLSEAVQAWNRGELK